MTARNDRERFRSGAPGPRRPIVRRMFDGRGRLAKVLRLVEISSGRWRCAPVSPFDARRHLADDAVALDRRLRIGHVEGRYHAGATAGAIVDGDGLEHGGSPGREPGFLLAGELD